MNSKLYHNIAFTLSGLITVYGLYIGIRDDIWGWLPYALVSLAVGLFFLKKNGTVPQAKSAHHILKAFAVTCALCVIAFIVYLYWMDGFTF